MKKSIQQGAKARAGHDPRAAALLALDMVLEGRLPSQAALDAVLRDSSLVPSDASLCTELVYGVLRQKLRLDWALRRLLKKPDKLPGECLLVVTMAAYELAFLDRVPGYASLNWAVSRVRHRFGQGLAGVANGSLRAFQRGLADFRSPDFYRAAAGREEGRAIYCGLPPWVLAHWQSAYGREAAWAYAEASMRRPVPGVRVHLGKEGAEALHERLVREHGGIAVGSSGVAFPAGMPYEVRRLEGEGRVSRQSPAVLELLEGLNRNTLTGPVWDACAGRGGKSLALLEWGRDVRVATDTSKPRLAAMRGELDRLGFGSRPGLSEADGVSAGSAGCGPLLILADAANPPFSGQFGTIVLDVPCSGLGTLSRRPEVRLRRREGDISGYVAVQEAMLHAASGLLMPEGRLVYSTCTLHDEENGERVKSFLATHPAYVLESVWTTPPGSAWNEFMFWAVLRRASN